MKKTLDFSHIDLQLFAEGGSAGASGAAAGSDGASSNGSDGVTNTGENTTAAGSDTAEGTVDRASQYAKFKEDYKAEYDADVQKLIRNRLHKANNYEKKTQPLFSALADKYGVDASNIDAIIKAVEEDDSFYQEKALEAGLTVAEYKEKYKMQQELERYRAQDRERRETAERTEAMNRLYAQAEEVKKVFPDFDINKESQNPDFARLVSKGVPCLAAYKAVHHDDIVASAMATAVQKASDKLSASVAANASRPNENGMSSQSSAISTVDVKNLSKEQMSDFKKRALAGEKITFREKQF